MNSTRRQASSPDRNGTASAAVRRRMIAAIDRGDYQRLIALAEAVAGPSMPALPTPDSRGLYPAEASARAAIARGVMSRRIAAGLSQSRLAELAGVRFETVNRLENARHMPGMATFLKIDRALTRAGAPGPSEGTAPPPPRRRRNGRLVKK